MRTSFLAGGFFACVFLQTVVLCEVKAFPVPPPPETVLQTAGVVLVGSFVLEGNISKLNVLKTLKGPFKAGDTVVVYPVSETFSNLLSETGSEPFLFCGAYDPVAKVLLPVFEMSTAMPGGVPEELLPTRTLEQTVAYAERILGLPITNGDTPKEWKQWWPSPREFVPVGYPVLLTPEMEQAEEEASRALLREREIAEEKTKREWIEDRQARRRAVRALSRAVTSEKGGSLTRFTQGALCGLAVVAVALVTAGRVRKSRMQS